MGTINQKIRFTKNAVDDIELALNEKGVSTKDVPLSIYGNLIRTLGNGGSGTTILEYEVVPQSFKIGYEKMFEQYYVPRPLDYSHTFIRIENDDSNLYEVIPTPIKIDYTMS